LFNIPGLSFLNTGVTLANIHSDGKEDNDNDMLNNALFGRLNNNNLVSNAKIAHYSKVSENIRLEKAGSKNEL
jgi:hypothetical protein